MRSCSDGQPLPCTLPEALSRHVKLQPDSPAFVFVRDNAEPTGQLSYRQLDIAARAYAEELLSACAPGENVVMLYRTEPAFIVALLACMYAGVVGVPLQVPVRSSALRRVREICRDARTATVLATGEVRQEILDRFADDPEVEGLRWIDHPTRLGEVPAKKLENPDPDGLAILQYTSGSTGRPKGVMISHRNLCYQAAELNDLWPCETGSAMVSWLPAFHDMGLMFGIILPLWAGMPAYLMPPETFLRNPVNWLMAISRFRATHSPAPDFAFELCIRRIPASAMQDLDLSSWRVAVNGAEKVRWRTVQQFAREFAGQGLAPEVVCPGYGLAENTLKVSGSRSDSKAKALWVTLEGLQANRVEISDDPEVSGVPIVSCGVIPSATQVKIVHPATRLPCASSEIGEIWVSGPCVGKGYWSNPVETRRTFKARIVGDDDAGPFLRTGDLGFIHERELYLVGRLKDLLIIHGKNYHPEDIEHTVETSYAGLLPSCAAAFPVEQNDTEQLVVAVEVSGALLQGVSPAELQALLIDAINAEHQLPVADLVLVRRGSLPKTTSGKIRRKACREAYLTGTLAGIGSASHPVAIMTSGEPGGLAQPPDEDGSQSDTAGILEWLRDWGTGRVNSRLIDERRCIPPHLVLDLGNQGLLGMQVPPRWGGLGLEHRAMLQVIEQLAAIDLTLATFVCVNNGLGVRPILRHGGPGLRDRMLPELASGRSLAAFAMTETVAGSAVHSIAATAIPSGAGRWQISGQKIWSGSAAWAGVVNTFVKVLDDRGQPAGFAGFAVPFDAPGLRIGEEALTMGMRGMVQSNVHYDAVPVTDADLLGEAGDGMAAARDTMMHARLLIAILSLGAMKRAVQLQVRYSTRRDITSGRLFDNPVTLERISAATAAISAVEALAYRTAALLDAGNDVPDELFVACKIIGPELLWKVADGTVQTLGGRGYIETNVLPQLLRDARVLRIFEGPTEVMLAHLGSALVKKSPGVATILTEHCDSPDLLAELSVLAESTTGAVSHHMADLGPTSPSYLAHQHLGRAVAYAVIVGMLRGETAKDPAVGHALIWAEERLQAACRAARHGYPDHLMGPGDLLARVTEYSRAIGMVDQNPAGIGERLDALLAPDLSEERTPVSPSQIAGGPPVVPAPSALDAEAQQRIRRWLIAWVAEYTGTPANAIDPDQPFLRHGLDSVGLLALSGELERYLETSLAPSLLWDFPTITNLSRELAVQS